MTLNCLAVTLEETIMKNQLDSVIKQDFVRVAKNRLYQKYTRDEDRFHQVYTELRDHLSITLDEFWEKHKRYMPQQTKDTWADCKKQNMHEFRKYYGQLIMNSHV